MGYLSHITGQEIGNIIEAGQGLAFVVYPYAVTTIAGAPFWAISFFLMLVMLGLSSAISNVGVTSSSILDAFQCLRQTKLRQMITVTCIFVIYFALGLLFCQRSGTYWIEIFNTYVGGWGILLVGACECIIVSYVYGLKNFTRDINVMMGDKTVGKSIYLWCALWACISPLLCIVRIFFYFDFVKTNSYLTRLYRVLLLLLCVN